MKKAEKILVALAVVGLIGRFLNWPYMVLLLLLGGQLLMWLYLVGGYWWFTKWLMQTEPRATVPNQSRWRKWGAVAAGMALAAGLSGILYRVQSWPGASTLLVDGLLLLAVLLVITGYKYHRTKDRFYSNILLRASVLLVLCLLAMSLPTIMWYNLRFPDKPEYAKALLEARTYPDSLELQQNLEELRLKMRAADSTANEAR